MRELSPYLFLGRKQRFKQWLKSQQARFKETARPDFMVIGAQKGGTTSMQQLLAQHPRITSAQFKELHYFSNDSWYSPRTLHQYHSFFPTKSTPGTKHFETTPIYLYHPKVAQRLSQYNRDLKLIVMLRNPALRALSAWKMYHYKFNHGPLSSLADPRSFPDAVQDELRGDMSDFSPARDHYAYVKRGLYAQQLKRYFECFPRDQILVVNSERFRFDAENGIKRVLGFLGVSELPLEMPHANPSVDSKTQFEEEVELLREFYMPHNEELFELLGESWDW